MSRSAAGQFHESSYASRPDMDADAQNAFALVMAMIERPPMARLLPVPQLRFGTPARATLEMVHW
jgi:hypothetical protein